MLKILLFFYIVSVLVFFILFMSMEGECKKIRKMCGPQPEKRSAFSWVTDMVSLLAFSLVPGLRAALFLMVAYGVSVKKEELEKQEGVKEDEICSHF